MKQLATIILLLFCTINLMAQEDVIPQKFTMTQEYTEPKIQQDSLDISAFYPGFPALPWNNYGNWLLHTGLNIQLDAAIFAEFGKHAHHGVGFAQNISMLYAQPLTNKLTLSIGGRLGNVSWLNTTFRDLSLDAVLNYRFNERLEGFVYGQKSIISNYRLPYYHYLQDINNLGDRIGIGAKYSFSSSFSVELRVEERRPGGLVY